MTKRVTNLLHVLPLMGLGLVGCTGDDINNLPPEQVGTAFLAVGGGEIITPNSLRPMLLNWSGSPATNRFVDLFTGTTYTYTRYSPATAYTKAGDDSFHAEAEYLPFTLAELASGSLPSKVTKTYTTATPKAWSATMRAFYELVTYAVECSFDTTKSVNISITDNYAGDGVNNPQFTVTADGIWPLNDRPVLAPNWYTQGLTASEKKKVSSCFAAHANKYGLMDYLDLRSPGMGLTAATYNTFYDTLEGAFFGNVFDPSVGLFSCGNASKASIATAQGRECTQPSTTQSGVQPSKCTGITYVGECSSVCTMNANPQNGYNSCSYNGVTYTEVMTSFLASSNTTSPGTSGPLYNSSGGYTDIVCSYPGAFMGISADANQNFHNGVCRDLGDLDIAPDQYSIAWGINPSSPRDYIQGTRYTLTDWDGGNYRIQCGPGWELSSLTLYNGNLYGAQCDNPHKFRGEYCHGAGFPSPMADSRGFRASGDWDYGYYKLECKGNEHVAGLAYGVSGGRTTLKSLLCCAN